MKKAGVGTGMLSAWHAPSGPMIGNDQVAEWCAAHPDRFAGLASADLARPMEAVRELRRRVEEDGFGACDSCPGSGETPRPTAASIRSSPPASNWVFPSAPGRPPGRSCLRSRPADSLHRPGRDRLPELVIVGGHIGYPWTEEMVAVCRKHENVYIDTSALHAEALPRELIDYMKTKSGRRKVLWGSNFPMIGPAAALEGIGELGLDDETNGLFLGGNARRVFGLPG